MKIFTVNIPSLPVLVKRRYLNPGLEGFEKAYLITATAISGRPLFFGVHLESGALYTRLPITALVCDRYNEDVIHTQYSSLSLQDSQPWSCLEGNVQYICYDHLKGSRAMIRIPSTKEKIYGHYLFTIDYEGDGLTEDPGQYKSHNVVALDGGSMVAYPNNYMLFLDDYFTDNEDHKFPDYRRQEKYWMPGG